MWNSMYTLERKMGGPHSFRRMYCRKSYLFAESNDRSPLWASIVINENFAEKAWLTLLNILMFAQLFCVFLQFHTCFYIDGVLVIPGIELWRQEHLCLKIRLAFVAPITYHHLSLIIAYYLMPGPNCPSRMLKIHPISKAVNSLFSRIRKVFFSKRFTFASIWILKGCRN